MTSKQAINVLSEKNKTYDVQVEAVSGGTNGKVLAKAIISIFEHTEKGPIITKKSSAYGSGSDLEKAQDKAIVKAVQGLGL